MPTDNIDAATTQSARSQLQYTYTTTGISSIPPEILQEIFLSHPGYLHVEHQPWSDVHRCTDNLEDCRPLCWIAVSHVCRRWRAVSLRCRPLWTNFLVSPHPEWTAEVLRRSGDAPLVINADMSSHDRSLRKGREASLELVLGQLYRIHRLHLHTTYCLTREAVRLLAGVAPILEEIHLGGYLADRDMCMSSDAHSLEYFYFPRMLLAKNTPLLRRMSVRYAHLGIKLIEPCSSTLQELTIHMAPYVLFPWPCLPELMDVLRMTPSLKKLGLKVDQSCNIFSHGHAANLPSVALPCVCMLTLRARASDCIGILNVLDLPALAFLDVNIWTSPSQDIQQLAPILGTKISSFKTTRTLEIEGLIDDDGSRSLRAAGFTRTDYTQTPPRNRRLFNLTFRYDSGRLDDVHTMFNQAFPSKHNIALLVKGEHIGRSVWHLMLRSFKSIPSLVAMGGPAASHLLPLLRIREPHSAGQDGRRPVSLPRLTGLVFKNTRLDVVTRTRDDTADTGVQELYSILHGRAVAGMPFYTLKVMNCSGITQSTATNLRHVLRHDGELEIKGCDGVQDVLVAA